MIPIFRAASLRVALAASSLAAGNTALYAQFHTPSIDGVIQPGEYGNVQNRTNQIGTNTGQTWYMTWDAAHLYVGIANANLSEGAVVYIDASPANPPNGGASAGGNVAGFNYDGEEIATLPFRAQFVTYFKDGYNEYRNSDGNGNWTNPVSGYGTYASAGSVREFAIPWQAITGGGMPSSFLFLGLLSSIPVTSTVRPRTIMAVATWAPRPHTPSISSSTARRTALVRRRSRSITRVIPSVCRPYTTTRSIPTIAVRRAPCRRARR